MALSDTDPAELGFVAEAEACQNGLTTRMLHAGLAGAIMLQLGSSQIMNPDGAGNAAFRLHEYSGLAAFGLISGFWAVGAMRRRGTPLGRLLPWFSTFRRRDLWQDLRLHLTELRRLRLPRHEASSPFAAAIHGLGLLLMTAMAVSGTVYYFVNSGDPDAGGLVGLTMTVHRTLANLVWAYLIGHAGMAVLAHWAGTVPLGRMWSFRRG
jgi:hypothetical protein